MSSSSFTPLNGDATTELPVNTKKEMVDEVKTERSQTPTPPADVASPPATKDTKAKPKKPATPRKKKTATADVVMADANDADEPGSPKAKAKKPATPRKPKVKAEVTDGDATDGAEPKEGGAEVKPKKTPTPRKRKSTSGTGEDGEPTTANGEDGDKSPTKKTPTARKRKSGSSTGDDGVAAATAAEGDDEESPTKKKKATPKSGKKTDAYPLSTSADNISEVDKMILTMKDDEGKSWVEIKAKWEEMTGMKPGNSTLGNRYAKLKSNFTVFADGDEERLMKVKKVVEEEFEHKKWAQIQKGIEEDGGKKYTAIALQKRFKDLEKNGFKPLSRTSTPATPKDNRNGGNSAGGSANGADEHEAVEGEDDGNGDEGEEEGDEALKAENDAMAEQISSDIAMDGLVAEQA